MTLRNTTDRWGSLSMSLHWLIAVLILVLGIVGLSMDSLPKTPSYFWVYTAHKSLGITVLALVVVRLAWRLYAGRPEPAPGIPAWQERIAEATHWLIYVLIFAVPLSGWLFDSATALRPLHWWGAITMPSLTGGPAPDWAGFTRSLHHFLFWTLVAVVALHVAAALKHHLFDCDNVLRRMLPWTRLRHGDPRS